MLLAFTVLTGEHYPLQYPYAYGSDGRPDDCLLRQIFVISLGSVDLSVGRCLRIFGGDRRSAYWMTGVRC